MSDIPNEQQDASLEELGAAVLAAVRAASPGSSGQAARGTHIGTPPPPRTPASGHLGAAGSLLEPSALRGGHAAHPQSDGSRPPALVMLRPISSGLPFGLFGLVAATTLVGAELLGILPSTASVAIGLLLLPTAVAQLVASVASILGRDVIAATLMMTFSGVWLATALVFVLNPPHGLLVLGVWYLALAPVILCLISSATGKLALSIVPMIGLPTFVTTGVWLIYGGKGLAHAAGVLSLVLGLAALYAAVALLFEDSRRRTVLPTLRQGPMRTAFTGDFPAQLEGLEHEAGVRRFV